MEDQVFRKSQLRLFHQGGDGSGLIPLAQTILSVLSQGIDIFLPDHRGTGFSSIVVTSSRFLINLRDVS